MEAALCADAIPQVKPYWDPVLRFSRKRRHAFFSQLAKLGLGGY